MTFPCAEDKIAKRFLSNVISLKHSRMNSRISEDTLKSCAPAFIQTQRSFTESVVHSLSWDTCFKLLCALTVLLRNKNLAPPIVARCANIHRKFLFLILSFCVLTQTVVPQARNYFTGRFAHNREILAPKIKYRSWEERLIVACACSSNTGFTFFYAKKLVQDWVNSTL